MKTKTKEFIKDFWFPILIGILNFSLIIFLMVPKSERYDKPSNYAIVCVLTIKDYGGSYQTLMVDSDTHKCVAGTKYRLTGFFKIEEHEK